ncbi:37S ribosomal protein S24, mitochondrial [Orbilia ellipsospora]|uniref:37S ribosomal protein S24, mitochondrial n=1 Tax=Orbilia ellipsospora TaxID=2528407 RepID=A0AAV9WZM2_9PEZI
MALSSRRALASLRRTTGHRQCGLLVPSPNLPPRPIYPTIQRRTNSRWSNRNRDEDDDGDGDNDRFEFKRPVKPKEKRIVMSGSAQEAQRAREHFNLSPTDPVFPTVDDLFNWPKDYEDNEADLPPELEQLPLKQRRALKIPMLPKQPITSESMYQKLTMTDGELENMATSIRTRHDPRWKKHGLINLKKEDVDEEDLEGFADLADMSHKIGDGRFSESEILSIMRDDTEPQSLLIQLKEIIAETEKDMADDILRLKEHEEQVLQEEIKLRIDEGMTPEEAEHDARAIMRLPQKRTAERQSLSRDLSDEAIEITSTLWNSELKEMGEKGQSAMMRQMEHDHQWKTRPLKPTPAEAEEMWFIPGAKQESEDQSDPMIWAWNSTDMSSLAHEQMEEHREARKYARLSIYDMPRLSRFAKPFKVPNDGEVLRFRYTTHMGARHPSQNKVVMECCPDDMGLTNLQRDKLIKLCGTRYNPTRNILKFSCEMFEHQHQNKRWLSELIDKLVEEARDDTDTFEDVPFDFRHHKFKKQKSFPKEWRMPAEKLELKRLKDWRANATAAEWEQLRVYMANQASERKAAEEEKRKVKAIADLPLVQEEVMVSQPLGA